MNLFNDTFSTLESSLNMAAKKIRPYLTTYQMLTLLVIKQRMWRLKTY